MRSHIKKSEPFIRGPLVFFHLGKIVVSGISVEKKSGSGNPNSTIYQCLLSSKINNLFPYCFPARWEKFQDGVSQSKSVSLNVAGHHSRFFETSITYTYSRIIPRAGTSRKHLKLDGAGMESNQMSYDAFRKINSGSVTNFPVWEEAGGSTAFPKAKKDYIRTDTGKLPGSLLWISQDASFSRKTRDPMNRPMTSHKKPMISFEKNHRYNSSAQTRTSGSQSLSSSSVANVRYDTCPSGQAGFDDVFCRTSHACRLAGLRETSFTNNSVTGFFSSPGPEMIFMFSSGMHSASKEEQF